MAKNINKSVIEDIAYELKRAGLITKAYEDKTASEGLISNFGDYEDFDLSSTSTINWITENIANLLSKHDPTFNNEKFKQQSSFEIDL